MKSSTLGPGLSDEWSMISIYNQSQIFADDRLLFAALVYNWYVPFQGRLLLEKEMRT